MKRGGVNKGYPSTVGPVPRSRTGHAQAGRRRTGDGRPDIGNPQGQVMHPLAPGVEESPKRSLPRQRLQQLDLRLPKLNESDGRVFASDRGAAPLEEAQGGKWNRRLGVEIPYDDGEMLEAGDRGHTTADG